MVHIEVRDFPYHRQDNGDTCGIACAQMVLQSVHGDVPPSCSQQSKLLKECKGLNSKWENENGFRAGPIGLTALLNSYSAHGIQFSAVPFRERQAAERLICWQICSASRLPEYGRPAEVGTAPITLWEGHSHWIAVTGFVATAEPRSHDDTEYDILGFDVNDPAIEPPHYSTRELHRTGDSCGGRSLTDYRDMGEWSAHFEPASIFENGPFVVICDSRCLPQAVSANLVTQGSMRPSARAVQMDGDMAIEAVAQAIEISSLHDRESWRNNVGKPAYDTPIRVHRLDSNGQDYFIVPLMNGDQLSAVAIVDESGFRRVTFASRKNAGALRLLGELYREYANGQGRMGEDFLRELRAKSRAKWVRDHGANDFSVAPTLVWRPCRQSLSPYFPFHVATCGGRRVFMRIDGRVCTRLHTNLVGT